MDSVLIFPKQPGTYFLYLVYSVISSVGLQLVPRFVLYVCVCATGEMVARPFTSHQGIGSRAGAGREYMQSIPKVEGEAGAGKGRYGRNGLGITEDIHSGSSRKIDRNIIETAVFRCDFAEKEDQQEAGRN